jgi:putative transposase
MHELANGDSLEISRWPNNRFENSHLLFRRRETGDAQFQTDEDLTKVTPVHASVHNHFILEHHLVDQEHYEDRRSAALAEWQILVS